MAQDPLHLSHLLFLLFSAFSSLKVHHVHFNFFLPSSSFYLCFFFLAHLSLLKLHLTDGSSCRLLRPWFWVLCDNFSPKLIPDGFQQFTFFFLQSSCQPIQKHKHHFRYMLSPLGGAEYALDVLCLHDFLLILLKSKFV